MSQIQNVFELADGSALFVTVARYKTPALVDIDKVLAATHFPPAIAQEMREYHHSGAQRDARTGGHWQGVAQSAPFRKFTRLSE